MDVPPFNSDDPSPTVPPALVEDRVRLFNMSLDLLCVAGLDGYFRHVNPSWTRVLGWSQEELLSRPIADFMHPDDRERTLQARAGLAKGIPVRGLENRYLCKDGSFRWLSWQSSIEPGGTTVFAVARDITDRRQSDHEQLVLARLQSTATLAAGIAHDFNNLLASLSLNLDMLGLVDPVTATQQRHLRQAAQAIESARSLTNQLIAFARQDASADRVTMRVGLLLRESLELSLRGTNLRGELDLPDDLWPAEINPGEISQVVRSLALNAREAMPNGGELQLRAENLQLARCQGPGYPSGNYIRFVLTDAGTGIPPDVMPRVFDPYFSTKRRGSDKGMGLGLTICHTILQKHGGFISVVPRPDGVGTAVQCYLPALPDAVTDDGPVSAVSAPASRVPVGKVLVMDDEPGVLAVLSESLTQLGCEVTLAEDGDTAIRHYREAFGAGAPFGLVMLDLTVRGGPGGVEVLDALRALDPRVNAVLMTGYGAEFSMEDYRAHGFRSVLNKPFALEELRVLVGGLEVGAGGRAGPDARG